jgi:hypothetical protein
MKFMEQWKQENIPYGTEVGSYGLDSSGSRFHTKGRGMFFDKVKYCKVLQGIFVA